MIPLSKKTIQEIDTAVGCYINALNDYAMACDMRSDTLIDIYHEEVTVTKKKIRELAASNDLDALRYVIMRLMK